MRQEQSQNHPRVWWGRSVVLLASLLTFAISANIAWLNPFPENEAYRMGPTPVLWQYNPDAGVELVSAAWFPEAFRLYPQRISRPLYPALVHGISLVVERVAEPVRPLSRIEAAGVAYAGLKLITVLVAGQAAFAVLRRRLDVETSVIGAVLLITHWHLIEYGAAFHTTDLQMTSTLAVLWIASIVKERRLARAPLNSRRSKSAGLVDGFVAGLAVGLLLLAKQTLVAPLAVLAVLVLRRRFTLAASAIFGAVLPHLVYLGFLRVIGVSYVSWEVQEYGQGLWLVEAARQPMELAGEIMNSAISMVMQAGIFYGPVLGLAVVGLFIMSPRMLEADDRRWITLALFAAFAQYVAIQREVPYMTADLAVVVFGAAAIALTRLRAGLVVMFATRGSSVRSLVERKNFLIIIVAAWLAHSVIVLANIPLVPPHQQLMRDPTVLENRRDILERPDRYSDEDRVRARDGVLVSPTS